MQAATKRRFPHVPAGAGEAYAVLGELLTFKVTNADTDGAFTVVELLAQPGGGPPLHTHPSSESFTILEGEFEFSGLDDNVPYTIRAVPGDTVYIPGGAPHTYKAVGDQPGKTMLVFTPGTEMEQFFTEVGECVAPGEPVPAGPPDIPALVAAGQRHGLAFVGPGGQ
jgi:quercetin dioxygenase-like cupin family protein